MVSIPSRAFKMMHIYCALSSDRRFRDDIQVLAEDDTRLPITEQPTLNEWIAKRLAEIVT